MSTRQIFCYRIIFKPNLSNLCNYRTAEYRDARGTRSPRKNSPSRIRPAHFSSQIQIHAIKDKSKEIQCIFFFNPLLCITKLYIKNSRKYHQHSLPVQFFTILWIISTFTAQLHGTEISSPRNYMARKLVPRAIIWHGN